MYYVYIIQLKNLSYYVGYSENLKTRIMEHNRNMVKTIKDKGPLELIFYSAFKAKPKAIKFERYLKGGSGFAFRNKHLV